MKKKLVIASLIFVVGFVLCLVYTAADRVKQMNRVNAELQTFPEFNLVDLDSVVFVPPRSRNTIIILFDPQCDVCEKEATEIRKNIHSYEKSTFLWISTASLNEVRSFSESHSFDTLENFYFTKIDPTAIYKIFGSVAVPRTLMYDEKGKLQHDVKGVPDKAILIF